MQETTAAIWSLFLSAFISSTIAPGGSEAVLAYLLTKSPHQTQLLVIVATIGNTLGAMTTWFLGMLAAKKFPTVGTLSERKQKSLTIVREKGRWVLLFSWLPVVGDALCFAGGWLKYPLISSCLIILAGKFARYAFIAWMLIPS